MKNEAYEDIRDSQEIKKLKEEQKRTSEDMATWKPGQGLSTTQDGKKNVRG